MCDAGRMDGEDDAAGFVAEDMVSRDDHGAYGACVVEVYVGAV